MKKSIEYIMELAKQQSITKAANNLYITPSALSKFIQTKEKEIGVCLFDRVGKKLILTYAGERYISWCNEILAISKNMKDELSDISLGKKGKVHFGFICSQSKYIISTVIPNFKKEFRNINIVIEENKSYELETMLLNNEIDFAIISVDRKHDKLIYHKLIEEEMVLAVHKNNSLIDKSIKKTGFKYPWIDIKLFSDYDFIMPYPEQYISKFCEILFKKYNMEPNKPIQVHMVDTSLQCVKNNLGVTIILDDLLSKEFKDEIVPLSFGDKPETRELSLVYNSDHYLEKSVKSMIDICKKFYMKI